MKSLASMLIKTGCILVFCFGTVLEIKAQFTAVKGDFATFAPNQSIQFQNKVFFSYEGVLGNDYGVWVSDGTTNGTLKLTDLSGTDFMALDNNVYFTITGHDRSRSLWRSDGTQAGTQQVYTFEHSISPLLKVRNQLFFVEYTQPETGLIQLKMVDDHQNEVQTIADIYLFNALLPDDKSDFVYATVANDKMHFFFRKPGIFTELWVSDGTAGGTTLFHQNLGNVSPQMFVSGNYIFFNSSEGGQYSNFNLDVNTGNIKKLGDFKLENRRKFLWKNLVHFYDPSRSNKYLYHDPIQNTLLPSNDFEKGFYYKNSWKGDDYFLFEHVRDSEEYLVLESRNENDNTRATLLEIKKSAWRMGSFIPVDEVLYWGAYRTDGTAQNTHKVLPYGKYMNINGALYAFTDYKLQVYQPQSDVTSIQDFFPKEGSSGDTVTIRGNNFIIDNVPPQVYLGVGTQAQLVSISNTEVKAIVPEGVVTGLSVSIYAYGVQFAFSQIFSVKPKITGFSPKLGVPGEKVTIYGSGFIPYKHILGPFYDKNTQNVVKFNGIDAPIKWVQADRIVVKVPEGATTGKINVFIKTNAQSDTSVENFVIGGANIRDFSPKQGKIGEVVTLYGTGFDTDGLAVYFNGTSEIAQVLSSSATEMQVKIPDGALSGHIVVRIPGFNADITSPEDFRIEKSIYFNPKFGVAGDEIFIYPSGFVFNQAADENIVKFNGTVAAVTRVTNNYLVLKVPENATSGAISVDVNNRRYTSVDDFIIGTEATILDELSLYPNPVSELLQLKLVGVAFDELQIILFDIKGQQVLQSVLTLQNGTATLNLKGLTSGKYILKIQAGEKAITRSVWKR